MDTAPYQSHYTAPTDTNIAACSIYSMSHDAPREYDALADLRDASRERLLTEIGMLRQQNGTAAVSAMQHEVLAARDAVFGTSAELGELRAQLKRDVRNAHISTQANLMNTPTWKVGAFVLLPLRLVKRFLRKK